MIDEAIYQRAVEGCITKDDVLHLIAEASTDEIFSLADDLRQSANGDVVTYVVNRNINFTNNCIGSCKFCAFRSDNGNGYVLTDEEIIQKVGEAVALNATEICIQGGLLDGMQVNDYCSIIELIKSHYPRMHVHAFSPMEVMHMSRNTKIDASDALNELKKTGLDSMPGTAAEILNDEIRASICPSKLKSSEWRDIVISAHNMGMPTTSTMMYGHVESFEDRVNHMFFIKSIQNDTGGFTEFVPLPFMSKNTKLEGVVSPISNVENLMVHAIARIILHKTIPNIQASWVKMGHELAQESLSCGVNDLGGTLMEENISRSAGVAGRECMSVPDFQRMIINSGKIPMQRDTLYGLL